MAEWFKAAVLKTVVRKYRGFESYSLRQRDAGPGLAQTGWCDWDIIFAYKILKLPAAGLRVGAIRRLPF